MKNQISNSLSSYNIKPIPPVIINLIQSIIRQKSTNILADIEQLKKLLKDNNLEFRDTEQDFLHYKKGRNNLLLKEAKSMLTDIVQFNQKKGSFTNKAFRLKRILLVINKDVKDLDIAIKDENELNQIISVYCLRLEGSIREYIESYRDEVLLKLKRAVSAEEFSKPFKHNENIHKLKAAYNEAVKQTKMPIMFFKYHPNTENTIEKLIKDISILEAKLCLRLISNQKLVLANYVAYSNLIKFAQINPLTDLELTKDRAEKEIFAPMIETLNRMYTNLTAKPDLCETISENIINLERGHKIITKYSSQGLLYTLDSLKKLDPKVLYKARARHLYKELKHTGNPITYRYLDNALRKAGVGFEYLETNADQAKRLISRVN